MTDFEGAGVVGGDLLLLRLPSFPILRLSFGGARAAPAFGTKVGTANDGLAALHYAFVGGDTIIFADSDDDGIMRPSDFSARLTGTHNLVQSDFRLVNDSGDTTFVIAGTNGATPSTAPRAMTRFSRSAAMTRSTASAATTPSTAATALTRVNGGARQRHDHRRATATTR